MLANLEQLVKTRGVFPVAVIVTQSNGRIVLVNGSTEAMFGYLVSNWWAQMVEILMPDQYDHSHARHRSDYNLASQPYRFCI